MLNIHNEEGNLLIDLEEMVQYLTIIWYLMKEPFI